jgi:hypothetical protein
VPSPKHVHSDARTCFRRARDTLREGLTSFAATGLGSSSSGSDASEDGTAAGPGTCATQPLASLSPHQRDLLPSFWGRAYRVPDDQGVQTCTFGRWGEAITYAAKAGRFPTGNGPRALQCTNDCRFCAIK